MESSTRALYALAAITSSLILALVTPGCGDPAYYGEQDGFATDPFTTSTQDIVGGQLESGYPAVGAVLNSGQEWCTGTLVTTTVVVTAAHCLDGIVSPQQLSFFLGSSLSNRGSGTTIPVSEFTAHPDYRFDQAADIATLVLSQPANVEPIPYLDSPMGNDLIGQQALFVGFGLTGQTPGSTSGEKRSARITLRELGPKTYFYSDNGRNTCNGDSGGPGMLEMDGVLTLLGPTSYGDENCIQFGANARTDVFVDFIQQATGGPQQQGSGDPCEDNGYYNDGTCDESCPMPDPDCDTGSGDFCTDQGLYNNGVCNSDCPSPDPDCDTTGGNNGDTGSGDWCADQGRYSDGTCDASCPSPDPDCIDNGNGNGGGFGDICAEQGWYGDGSCDEECAMHDPDCGPDPNAGGTPIGGGDVQGWVDGPGPTGSGPGPTGTGDGWADEGKNTTAPAAVTSSCTIQTSSPSGGPAGWAMVMMGVVGVLVQVTRRRR